MLVKPPAALSQNGLDQIAGSKPPLSEPHRRARKKKNSKTRLLLTGKEVTKIKIKQEVATALLDFTSGFKAHTQPNYELHNT
jgi:hypothetical protein